jgi:hypothetical protein
MNHTPVKSTPMYTMQPKTSTPPTKMHEPTA